MFVSREAGISRRGILNKASHLILRRNVGIPGRRASGRLKMKIEIFGSENVFKRFWRPRLNGDYDEADGISDAVLSGVDQFLFICRSRRSLKSIGFQCFPSIKLRP